MVYPQAAGYQAYQKNKYQTASPHKLTLMLYNGAIQFSIKAQNAIRQGNIPDSNMYIQKAQNIIYELISSLNTKEGGEIAHNLNQLYFYMLDKLIEANIKKQDNLIDDVIKPLNELKEAWEEIGKGGTLG